MPSSALHRFIALLESHNELDRITSEADPVLEIAGIINRECKLTDGGKALFFEHPKCPDFAVTANLYGSANRVCLALGVNNLEELRENISGLLSKVKTPDSSQLDRQIALLPEFSSFAPVLVSPEQSKLIEMTPPDLTRFPFLQSWPKDGSATGYPRYITLPLVFTASPDDGSRNCGMYRCQLRGTTELAVQCKSGSGAALHLEEFRSRGEKMPLAIVLGGDPSLTFSAMFPLPGKLDEMTFAGFLRQNPVRMTACRTIPLNVPADAEIVIEGHVDPDESVLEGPFGNHTGAYSPAATAPLMRVTCIRYRENAVVPVTVVGPPPMEDCWMAKAWEQVLSAFLKKLFPSVADIHFPLEWIFHQSGVISLENPHPGMVRETAELLWSTPWFKSARMLIFVDAAGCKASDISKVAWHGINLVDFAQDLFFDVEKKRTAIDATGCKQKLQRI